MKTVLLLASFLAFTACTHTKNSVENDVLLSEGLKAQKYSNIYFSGQPPFKSFAELKGQGFAAVINLRQTKEEKYLASEEEKAATKAGLNYTHIPTKGTTPLTDQHLAKITAAVVKHRNQGKVLIHCSSGNRAALWAGGHFFKDHDFPPDEALKIAERLGLKKVAPKTNLKNYLKQNK